MPTLLSLMHLPIPRGVEGLDLSHCVLGEPGPEPEAAFLQGMGATAIFEDGHEWRALRSRQFTYAVFRADRSELLFDNLADPYQPHNLAGDPEYAGALDHFREMLQAQMAAINDMFEACTWYGDHWTTGRIIVRTATNC